MRQPSRVFRVFVSSTFRDLETERDLLQQAVFGPLRELCEAHGCRFQAIDLRWGVSDEATRDHRTVEICLAEIARCQALTPRPNFLILLGDRYGWRPLPAELPAADFELLAAALAGHRDAGLLAAYARDDNAVPARYYLRPVEAAELPTWQATVEQPLRRLLAQAARDLGWVGERLDRLVLSATEQEIVEGLLRQPEAAGHVLCLTRPADGPAASDPDDPEAPALLTDLKRRLATLLGDRYLGCLPRSGADTAWAEAVRERLASDIREQLGRLGELAPEAADAAEQARFAARQQAHCAGREDHLAAIARYLASPADGPLVLRGPSGIGKTTILARAAQQARDRGGRVVVTRHLGATPRSTSAALLLHDLCVALTPPDATAGPVPTDYQELAQELRRRLELASTREPVVLVLDGLDQLAAHSPGADLAWLPLDLPDRCHLVASAADEALSAQAEERLRGARCRDVGRLSTAEGDRLLTTWLDEAGRRLEAPQREAVLAAFEETGSPLHLRLLLAVARRWRSGEPAREGLAGSVAGTMEALLERLERHHGQHLVGTTLSLLAAGRAGVAEDELLAMLAADAAVRDEFGRRRHHAWDKDDLPVVLWARLLSDLDDLVIERVDDEVQVYGFLHRQLASAVAGRYGATPAEAAAPHATLARYFTGRADPAGDGSWTGLHRRAWRELAWHRQQQAALTGDGQALFDLADDPVFRRRQFEVLHRIEPLLEVPRLALELAARQGHLAATVRYAQAGFELEGVLARTFRYRLTDLATLDPPLAWGVAGTAREAASSFMSRALVAWVLSRSADEADRVTRYLAELASSPPVLPPHFAPVLLAMVRDLDERGLSVARGLLRALPDCPQRTAARRAWGADRWPELAAPAPPADPADLALLGRAELLAVALDNHPSQLNGRTEERAAATLGFAGVPVLWALLAARRAVRGLVDEACAVLNRALYTHAAETPQPTSLLRALAKALETVREPDLAAEYRARAATVLEGRARFSKDPAERQRLLDQASQLEGPGPAAAAGWLPQSQRQLAAAVAARESAPVSAAATLEQAVALADSGRHREALEVLRGLPARLATVGEPARRSALAAAAAALAAALGDAGLAAALAGDEAPPTRRDPVPAPAATQAWAVAHRLAGRSDQLQELLVEAVRDGHPPEVIDQVCGQLCLLPGQPRDALVELCRDRERHDPRLAVPSGLGLFYGAFWSWPLWAGLAAAAAGRLAGLGPSALAPPALLVAGAALDLVIWRAVGLQRRPERSRRVATHLGLLTGAVGAAVVQRRLFGGTAPPGTALAFLLTMALLVLPMVWPPMFLRLLQARLTVAGVLGRALLGGVLILGGWAAAPWLAATLSPSHLEGLCEAGLYGAAIGLHLLAKFIPVRLHYRREGIVLGDGERAPLIELKLPGWTAPIPEHTALGRALKAVDRELTRGHWPGVVATTQRVLATFAADLPPGVAARLHLNRGYALRQLGHPHDALAAYDAAAAAGSVTSGLHLNRGLVLAQDLQRYEAASEAFEAALTQDPTNVEALSSGGLTRLLAGDLDGAAADLELAVELAPDCSDALCNLGSVRLQQGRRADAAELFRRALAATPRDPELRVNYALVLWQGGSPGAAGSVLRDDPRAVALWRGKGGPWPL